MLHFFSIDCIQAGFLVKKKGVWFITPEGEQSLSLGAVGLLNEATRKYREWKKEVDLNKPAFTDDVSQGDEGEVADDREREMALDEIEALALDGITKAINSKHHTNFRTLPPHYCARWVTSRHSLLLGERMAVSISWPIAIHLVLSHLVLRFRSSIANQPHRFLMSAN